MNIYIYIYVHIYIYISVCVSFLQDLSLELRKMRELRLHCAVYHGRKMFGPLGGLGLSAALGVRAWGFHSTIEHPTRLPPQPLHNPERQAFLLLPKRLWASCEEQCHEMNDHLHSLRFGVMIARVKGAGGARRIRVGFWVLLLHKYLQEPYAMEGLLLVNIRLLY